MSSDPVVDSVSEHRELLQELEATEYAPPTYAAMKKHLDTTKVELSREEGRLKKLVEETRKEFKDWEDIKNRTTKRLFVKVKHMGSHKEKLDAMEDKEEREYVAAFGKEQDSRAKISELKSQITDLEQQLKALEPYVAQNQRLQRQLAALYKRVFDGPTPQYPQEDAAENKYHAAEKRQRELLEHQTNLRRANQLVQRATMLITSAQRSAREAQSASQWDMWGGGRMADYMERSALGQAQNCIDQARMTWEQARQYVPELAPFPQTTMPMGNLFGDVFFDNIWSDMAFHQKIMDASRRLDAVAAAIRDGAQRVNARTGEAEHLAQGAGRELDTARKQLDGVRREIFERAANPAPQYTAAPAGDAAFAPPAGPPPQGGGYAPPGGPPPTGGPGGAGGAQGTPAAPPPEYRP